MDWRKNNESNNWTKEKSKNIFFNDPSKENHKQNNENRLSKWSPDHSVGILIKNIQYNH